MLLPVAQFTDRTDWMILCAVFQPGTIQPRPSSPPVRKGARATQESGFGPRSILCSRSKMLEIHWHPPPMNDIERWTPLPCLPVALLNASKVKRRQGRKGFLERVFCRIPWFYPQTSPVVCLPRSSEPHDHGTAYLCRICLVSCVAEFCTFLPVRRERSNKRSCFRVKTLSSNSIRRRVGGK